MTNEEALQLVKQGFTADEIRALGWNVANVENPDKVTNIPEQTPEEGADTSEAAKLPPEVESTLKGLSESVASLTETVKAMQVSNQKTAKNSRSNNAPKSADEVIKGFIESM